MLNKTNIKKTIILIIIAGIVTISGCVQSIDEPQTVGGVQIAPQQGKFINPNMSYEGYTTLPTTADGYEGWVLVMKMHDRSNGNDCYVTYNGISCVKGNTCGGN